MIGEGITVQWDKNDMGLGYISQVQNSKIPTQTQEPQTAQLSYTLYTTTFLTCLSEERAMQSHYTYILHIIVK